MRNQPEEGKMDLTNMDPVILCQDINPNDNELALISMDWVLYASKLIANAPLSQIRAAFVEKLTNVDGELDTMEGYIATLQAEVNFHKTNYAIEQHVHHEARAKESFEMMG